MDRDELIDKIVECADLINSKPCKSTWWSTSESALRAEPFNFPETLIQELKDQQPRDADLAEGEIMIRMRES